MYSCFPYLLLKSENVCLDVRLSEGLTERGVFPPGLQVDVEQDTGPVAGSDRRRIAAGKQVRFNHQSVS